MQISAAGTGGQAIEMQVRFRRKLPTEGMNSGRAVNFVQRMISGMCVRQASAYVSNSGAWPAS